MGCLSKAQEEEIWLAELASSIKQQQQQGITMFGSHSHLTRALKVVV